MKSILQQLEELQKTHDACANQQIINNIYYRIERMEKFLEENLEYKIHRSTPKHYNHRNMKV
jgi:hypothetical protein